MKSSGKCERWEEGESLCIYFAMECIYYASLPKSLEIYGCTRPFQEF